MRLRNITLTGMVLLLLASTTIAGATDQNTTDIEMQYVNVTGTSTETLTVTPTEEADDDGSTIGIFAPGHLLYRLKVAFDNMGEVFTFNASEKLGRQVSNARHRIAEYRAALKRNDIAAADIALAEYGAKMNNVKDSMSKLSDKDTGFINAQQMILKHQLILKNLSISHPNSTGLQRAFNNSKELQTKFASKTGKWSVSNIAVEDYAIPKADKTAKPEKGTKRSS